MTEEPGDVIDVMLSQWRRERPDLDLPALGLFGRVARLARMAEVRVEEIVARHGLRTADFDVLAALRRAGPPYTLMPSELSALLMMSRAGVTSRLDRLETAGLVRRELDRADRRSLRAGLTEAGHKTIDAALTEHTAGLARLAAGLSAEDVATLDRLLRDLLATLTHTDPRPGSAVRRARR